MIAAEPMPGMKRGRVAPVGAVILLAALLASCEGRSAHVRDAMPESSSCCVMRLIFFEDVRPAGRPLGRFWHGLGMDAQKRVYVGIIAMNVLRDQAKLVGRMVGSS